MLKKVALLLALCFTGLANAQMIDGKTDVLSKARGEKVLFTLADSSFIYTYPPENGWFKISVAALVDESVLIDEEKVLANATLYNLKGLEIGKTEEDVIVEDWKEGKGRAQKGKVRIVLTGYVFNTKIKRGTYPEDEIEKILLIKNREDQTDAFNEFYEKFGFVRRDVGGYRIYILFNYERPFDEENSFRMMVFLKDGSRFIGIGSNGREIKLKKEKDKIEDQELKLFLAARIPDKDEAVLRDLMINYIAIEDTDEEDY